MKKIFYLLMFVMTMSFTSCDTMGQVVVTDGVVYDGITYYDYYMDDYYLGDIPLICVDNLWYYQYWDATRSLWYRRPVPRDLWWTWRTPYYHNRGLGGRWIDRYPTRGATYRDRGMWDNRGWRGYQPNRGGNQRGGQPNTQPRTQQGGQRPQNQGQVSRPTQSRGSFNGQSRGNAGSPSRSMGSGSRGGMSNGGSRGGRR